MSPLLLRLFEWYFKGGAYVSSNDLQQIQALLELIAEKINEAGSLNRSDFVTIRLSVSRALASLSNRVFPASLRNQSLNVEHLNQNPILKMNSIAVICGSADWITF